jgi:HlyD family secretion protein
MSSANPQRGTAVTARATIRDTAAQDRVVQRPPMSGRRRWMIGLFILSLVATSAAVSPAVQRIASADRSVPLERLRLAIVTRNDFVRDVAVRGRVIAAVKPTVYAPAEGVVTLMVEAGDTVSESQVLAGVESPRLANELDQELATLQRMETELTRQGIEKKKRELRNQQTTDMARVAVTAAERELRRAQASWDEQIISLQDFEKAKDDLARARLEFDHAEANARLESESLGFEITTRALERDRQRLFVSELERRVAELEVRSPVAGIVGSLSVDQKAQVAENQPLMTVVDLTAFEIDIQVPQEYGDDLGLGMPAEITFSGSTHAGEITAISPEVRENQVSGRVRFAGDPPDGLRQNQRVSARILLESKQDTLTVQRGPFLDSGSGRIAYVVEGGLAHRREIQVGATSIGEVEVLTGLEEGQTIIISDLAQFEGAGTVLLQD